MTQTEHKSTGAGVSQADRILAHLEANRGEWVAMPTLVRISGAYATHSRISDLRRRGHQIEHQNATREGKKIMSFYKLL